MRIIIPNLQWYLQQSASKGVPSRCPFALVTKCPRFYQSLSLLGYAGNTKISKKENNKLLKKWKRSPFWPVTDEQSTWTAGEPGNTKQFVRFCPEILFERFGLFACALSKYADNIDIGFAHSRLSKERTSPDDWRWSWAHVEPQHYSECPLHSILLRTEKDSENKYEDIIDLKPNFCGIGLNINALVRKIWKKRKDLLRRVSR